MTKISPPVFVRWQDVQDSSWIFAPPFRDVQNFLARCQECPNFLGCRQGRLKFFRHFLVIVKGVQTFCRCTQKLTKISSRILAEFRVSKILVQIGLLDIPRRIEYRHRENDNIFGNPARKSKNFVHPCHESWEILDVLNYKREIPVNVLDTPRAFVGHQVCTKNFIPISRSLSRCPKFRPDISTDFRTGQNLIA